MASREVSSLHRSMKLVAREFERHCADLAKAAREDLQARDDRGRWTFSTVHAVAQQALDAPDSIALGMGFVGASTALGSPAIHWWYRPMGNEGCQPLMSGAHPTLTDYYDFEGSQWWQAAAANPDLQISSPYVDVTGTNAYAVTASLAVHVGDEFFGVAAVDVEVGTLQALWQPQLITFSVPTSVIDAEGSVIATNSGELLGGYVDLDARGSSTAVRVPNTPWSVIGTGA